jgi:AraC-like DNA-binding protein
MAAETARYWQHAGVPGVDLLRARFVTHRYNRHAHETYTFALIEAGTEVFDYGGSVLRAGTGSVALLNPEMVHTGHAETPAGWSYRVLYPTAGVVAAVAADLGWRRGTPSFPQTVVYDARSARLLRGAHIAAEHGDRLASSSLLRGALAGLLCAHSEPGLARAPERTREASAAVHAVTGLLAERIADPPSLDELAQVTGMSPFTLLRAFRGQTGLPPHAYLNQLRVRLARRMLDRGVPPAEVAVAVGFADQAHLTRHFKRIMGVPPGAYQRGRGGGGKNVQDPGQTGGLALPV